jgi:endo-1,4-beta-xylanase
MKRIFWLILFTGFCAALFAQNYKHETIIDSTFEDGTLGGWKARGSPERGLEKLEVVKDIKKNGTASLRISNRNYTWQGPVHLLTENPKAGDIYSMSAWIYYQEGPANAAFVFSVQRDYKNGSEQYQNVTTFQAKKGEWTEIKSEYSVSSDPTQSRIWVYFELPYKEDHLVTVNDKINFWMDDIKFIKLDPASRPKAEQNIPDLYDSWSRYFEIGTAVSTADVDTSTETSKILVKHFGILVGENEQKLDTVQPAEGRFNWEPAEQIIRFAEQTGMSLHWNTLVQHSQNPAWIFLDKSNPVSKDVLNQRLKTYIQTVVRRYKGRVESYNVVTEALSDRSGLRSGAEGSKWHQILGNDYIDNAFRWAKEADPSALLVINDVRLESNPAKLTQMVNLVKGMKARGVPVDAVGLQLHIDTKGPSIAQIRNAIEQLAAAGVKVMITGLDISIYSSDSEAKKTPTAAILLEQAQRYKDIFALFREQAEKKNLIGKVIIWGSVDSASWKNNFPVPGRTDAPLLFDGRLQSKPAFWGLVDPKRVQGLR